MDSDFDIDEDENEDPGESANNEIDEEEAARRKRRKAALNFTSKPLKVTRSLGWNLCTFQSKSYIQVLI